MAQQSGTLNMADVTSVACVEMDTVVGSGPRTQLTNVCVNARSDRLWEGRRQQTHTLTHWSPVLCWYGLTQLRRGHWVCLCDPWPSTSDSRILSLSPPLTGGHHANVSACLGCFEYYSRRRMGKVWGMCRGSWLHRRSQECLVGSLLWSERSVSFLTCVFIGVYN